VGLTNNVYVWPGTNANPFVATSSAPPIALVATVPPSTEPYIYFAGTPALVMINSLRRSGVVERLSKRSYLGISFSPKVWHSRNWSGGAAGEIGSPNSDYTLARVGTHTRVTASRHRGTGSSALAGGRLQR
jgi:hypothetical protein